jgi:inner membrane protein
MRMPVLAKAASLCAITLLLLIALARIGYLVDERRGYQQEAAASVRQSLADPQTLAGPFVARRCTEEWDVVSEKNGEKTSRIERRAFTRTAVPKRLAIDGTAAMEPRYRGLFKVNTYGSRLVIDASWDAASLAVARTREGVRLACDAPTLTLAMTDARGIRSAQLQVASQPRALLAGANHPAYARGFHAELASEWRAAEQMLAPLALRLTLDLVGTSELAFVPAGAETEVKLKANWPHPSFAGRFLPAERRVDRDGFEAAWRVSGLATDAAQGLAAGAPLCGAGEATQGARCLDTLSVAFIDPINIYVLSDRAIKYGLLFIVMTLAAVAMIEVIARRPVHPVQYLFVGAALTLFFLLLLSLSEHLPFGQAYAAAAAACALLLAHYATPMLGHWRRGLGFGCGIAAVFGAMYLLLQMEQTALVVGSLMLFATLAALMVLTRKLDWHALFAQLRARAPA